MDIAYSSMPEVERPLRDQGGPIEARSSGVSWGAVIGGAIVTAAAYLILLALGAGFGLSTVSPWRVSETASTLGAVAIVWLIVAEIVSSSLGGYLTGRLRTKWARIHTDEVFFRDTANGFLAWSLALVASAAFLASAASAMVGRAENRANATDSAQSVITAAEPYAYYVDTLLRSGRTTAADPAARAEIGRILTYSLRQGQMSQADQNYIAQLTASETGISAAEAQMRTADFIAQTQQAEDAQRKAAARFLLWLFLSLLIGAFSASYAATIGGRQRDHVPAV